MDGVSATRGEIERYQVDELRRVVASAKSTRFYGGRLRGIDPNALADISDLARIPFTTAQNLRGDPLSFLASSPDEIQRVVTLATSGTSAPPKRVYFTAGDIERTTEFFHRGMRDISGENGRVIVFMPGNTPDSVGDILRRGLTRLGRECVVYGAIEDYADAADAIAAHRASCAVGLPYQMLQLARRHPNARLRSVLLSADYIPRSAVNAIEQLWDCDVFSHYGMTETCYGGAVDCAYRTGMHIRERDLLVEIVDPASGDVLPRGRFGEIVITTLGRAGTLLLRYRTGDRGRILPGTCPCGSELLRLDHGITRLTAGVTLSGGETLTLSALDEALYALPSLYAYDACVDSRDGRDVLRIRADTECGAENGIAGAIGEIPEIGELVSNGKLILEITRGAGFTSTGAIKRVIADNRGRDEINI
jgi:phenylacetate-coenzyme A ligase PaaK-like adenylate-forming protein